ncbi:MAG: PA0069 family radical SAM protein [Nitrospirae bacterium]|nr:PA0069 family radical SAM protein [Nitrospirota bacterium]
MADQPPPHRIRGRGTAENPKNRFEHVERVSEPVEGDDEQPLPTTQFLPDASKSIIATNDSPDVGFDAGVNPYRGCEHGCAYCYARPTHEYLGFSAGLDFETKIMVKYDAPELLRRELSSPRWQPRVIAMSGVTDCYQPIERKLRLTRRCIEVLAEFRNPVVIITKNALVARDADVLASLAGYHAAAVFLSITTLDADLCGVLEPRTSRPTKRLAAIAALAKAGVPVGVNVAPVIPGLNDSEIPRIVQAAADAGATSAGFVPLRLPYAVAPLFEAWLERHRPGMKDKVLHRIREIRGGRLNDPNFGARMSGSGPFAEQILALFTVACRRAGLAPGWPELSTRGFRRPDELPLLFDA